MLKRMETISLILFFCLILSFMNVANAEKTTVAYGGLWLLEQGNFPLLSDANREKIATGIADDLQSKIESGVMKLPLVIETDAQKSKDEINDSLTMLFLITRADYSQEVIAMPGAGDIYMGNVYCSLSAIFMDSVKDGEGNVQHKIVQVIPRVGFQAYQLPKPPTEEELERSFNDVAINLLQGYLLPRVSEMSFDKVSGIVKDRSNKQAVIDIGKRHGVEKGNIVWFLEKNKKYQGRVEKSDADTAYVDFSMSEMMPQRGAKVETIDTRALSQDTYQVVNTVISSQRLKRIFGEDDLTPQIGQWFSDYLVKERGVVVLPPIATGKLLDGAYEESASLIGPAQQKMSVLFPPPSYTIRLNVTGVNSAVIKAGAEKKDMLYKAWLQGDLRKNNIVLSGYPRVTDHYLQRIELPGGIFSEKAVFRNLLEQTVIKFAKEMKLE